MRTPSNRLRNWNGTVHYANTDGTPACGPLHTHRAWLGFTTETVTCKNCIARYGHDLNGKPDQPAPDDEHRARRAAERAARRAARNAD